MANRAASLQGSLPRSNLVLAGPFWPISDEEGINGDYFMVLSTDGKTPIIFGPKANNTWVGVPQTAISTTPITYLQYLGDNAAGGVAALPSNNTGVPGQICFLLDINNNCVAAGINVNGIWSVLVSNFSQPTIEILSSGGTPVFITPVVQPPGGVSPI